MATTTNLVFLDTTRPDPDGPSGLVSLALRRSGAPKAEPAWMEQGRVYEMVNDGTVILVSGGQLDADVRHVLERSGRPVTVVPTLDGDVMLLLDQVYRAHPVHGPDSAWKLHAVDSPTTRGTTC